MDPQHPSEKIRFISQYLTPEAGATSELVSGIAKELTRLGFNVDALAGQPTYHGSVKLPSLIVDGGFSVRRLWSTQFSKDSAWGRVLNTLSFCGSVLSYQLQGSPDRLLVFLTNPPLLPWVGAVVNLLKGTRYILLIHDVYPDVAEELGALRRGGLLSRSWKAANRLTFHRAMRIIVLGNDMKRVVLEQLPKVQWPKVQVIPNWADGIAVKPLPKEENPLLLEHCLSDRFVVQYSGNIGRYHEILTILDAAKRLDSKRFCFLFFGKGKMDSVVRQAEQDGPENLVRLLSYQPRTNLGISLTACDVGLVTLKEGLSGLAVPSKLYGILAAGKPVVVIGPEDCEAAGVVTRGKCGAVIRPGDVDGLVRLLDRLRNDPVLTEEWGLAAREVFEESYGLWQVAQQWSAMLTELTRCTDTTRMEVIHERQSADHR